MKGRGSEERVGWRGERERDGGGERERGRESERERGEREGGQDETREIKNFHLNVVFTFTTCPKRKLCHAV